MESFKFKKPLISIDRNIKEEFNRLFSTIELDTFLFQTDYRSKPEVLSFTKKEDRPFNYSGERVEYDKAMDEFSGPEYDEKRKIYTNFLNWIEKHVKSKTILGRVYCPYTDKVIETFSFSSAYSMKKSKEYPFGWYDTLKVKDVFKYNLKNAPLNHMSKEALELFFDYWSYNVEDKITLRGAKDKNLVQVNSSYGTIYYENDTESRRNQLYYGPKGFFVKMRKERIYVPTPTYPTLEANLKLMKMGRPTITNKNTLPSLDEKITQAIESGVLDKTLAPKKDHEKAEVVKKLKAIMDNEDDVQTIYDEIKAIILTDIK